MNKKFDLINYDIPKFGINVEFKYQKYDEETEDINPLNDFNLDLKYDNVNMFLSNQISINLHDLRERLRFDSNISFLSNINTDVVEVIKAFQNKNLHVTLTDDNKDIEYFNSNSNLDDKSTSFVTNLDDKYKRRILEAYNLNNANYNNLTQMNQRNSVYSNDYLSDIMLARSQSQYAYDFKTAEFLSGINNIDNERVASDYLSKNISISANTVNDYVNNQLSLKNISSIYDELPVLFKFKPFELTPVIEDQAKLKQQTGVAFVGFLIKKHIKNKIGETFFNVASQFIYVDINQNNNLNEILLYDNQLNYANSYSYEISPVFYLGLYSYFGYRSFNFPLITHNLTYSSSMRSQFIRAVDYYAPEPPNAVTAKFLTKQFKAEIRWSHPTNPQNDVIGFQIYRRQRLDQAFELIKVYLKKEISEFKHMELFADNMPPEVIEISVDNSMKDFYRFIDNEVDLTKETYIYAICSIDAHGMVSNYSSQIGLRYSKIYNSLIVDQVSMQNAPRSYPNLYVQRKSQLFENDDLVFDFTPNFRNKEKMNIYFTPDAFKVKNKLTNQESEIFNPVNQYQISIARLNDLSVKNIKFKLNLP